MRMHPLVLVAVLAASALACARADTAPPTPAPVTEGPSARFYAALAPYGTWIDDASYGWVWLPSPSVVGTDFFPYMTGGNWLYTDAGWMFDSAYPWGWGPFHYGRWAFDAGLGWMWAPGSVWAPAWVDWRWNDGYIGWAPLPPVVVGGVQPVPRSHWVTVAAQDLTRPHLEGFLQPKEHAQAVFAPGATHLDSHSDWHPGPPAELVATASHEPLMPIHMTEPSTTGLVRSYVDHGSVHHEPFHGTPRAPSASSFPHNPPNFPLHVMRPHSTQAPVFDAFHGAGGGGFHGGGGGGFHGGGGGGHRR